MELKKILLEKNDGIAFVTFNEPQLHNAVSAEAAIELEWCLDNCGDDHKIRVIVLRGAGEFFSAGGNINTMKERVDCATDEAYEAYGNSIRKLGKVVMRIRNIRKPVIASMHGAAAGGGLNLALACDLKIAAENTKFIVPFVNIGLIPDVGGPLPLIRAIGVPRATELMMTGRVFSAREAYDWGLINQAVPVEQLEMLTLKMANQLANGPTKAYGFIKAMINRVAYEGLELEVDSEAEYQVLCAKTEDHKEGVYAFLDKRKPKFNGR